MQRILTALVALPILLYTVWSDIPYFFVAFAGISVLLALNEFYALAAGTGHRPFHYAGYTAALAVIACFVFNRPGWVVGALAALAIVAFAAALSRPEELDKALAAVAATVLGVVYIAVLAGFLIGVRMMSDTPSVPNLAPRLLTMFFAMVMMTDTGAYYTGRLLGRHKLAPRISPGKTIEGSIGGFIAAALTGPVCRLLFFSEAPLLYTILLGAAIGVLGQVGDLAESMLKRGAGVKDSGRLFPGHGGMLDRVDSILFCAPLLYYYSRLFTP